MSDEHIDDSDYDPEEDEEDPDAQVAVRPSKKKAACPVIARVSAESEWAHSGSVFMSSSRADKVKILPSGIYQFGANQQSWWLDRTNNSFEFPFKVYSASDEIINRITTYWRVNGGNLGILMNGLRGAGKTMTAQLLANELIKQRNIPVLVVKSPVPLQIVFDAVKQDLVVIFDEFEKTHDKDDQQKLLSVIDGTSRSKHSRLVIFTTNNPSIDENFRDRPSRIHYQFEFQRVADEIIEGLIADSLPADLKHFRQDILDFLDSRSICTIDIVKAVIAEVKTFREPPTEFEGMLNISKGEPPSYTVEILNPETGAVMDVVCYYFKADSRNNSMLNGSKRAIEDFEENGNPISIQYRSGFDGNFCLNLLQKCEEPKCWLAEIAVPIRKTPFKAFTHLEEAYAGYQFWMDNRPEDWSLPFTPESVKDDEKKMKALDKFIQRSAAKGTIYGSDKRAVFKIRVEPNRDKGAIPRRYSVTGKYDLLADDD